VGSRRREALRGTLAVLALVLVSAPAVIAAPSNQKSPPTADGARLQGPFAEGPADPSNLPAKQENLEVVGRLQIPGVRLGQIADLSVYKGFAYLNSWDDARCRDGGTYVVDIRNPSSPQLVTFIPADQPYYHGEGAHVVTLNTPAFQGDILAVNDETFGSNLVLDTPSCLPPGRTTQGGGFDLYDVSNPASPVPLVRNAGDRDNDNNPATPERAFANSYHSVFVWQDGPRAFLVASDNIELTDVDIFDITNPRAPVQVGDHDLVELFPQILDGEEAFGGAVFHHDVVVKHIGGRPVMKADYWDSGYVQMDVTDPANPVLINDTRFAGEDPLLPGSGLTPEGNAHQGEFSFDNQFLLAADEDFAPFRSKTDVLTGSGAGEYPSAEPGDTEAPIAKMPGRLLNGPTTYVGKACALDPVPAPPTGGLDPGEEHIAVIERGDPRPVPPDPDPDPCSFANKIQNVADAGWDGYVVFNQDPPPNNDALVNMLTLGAPIPGVHMRRQDALAGIFAGATATPMKGTVGQDFQVDVDFDGWGYAHLYDARTAEHIDAFAIDEALDSRFAFDFGDLSIHEFATDPTEHLAYSSYYAGGIRVFRYSRQNGLEETGAWIADGGSNFWGVEQFTTPQGQRLIAGSDRDFGLVILRYTGPGAAQPPACSDLTVMVAYRESANVPLNCSDPNGNPLRQSRTSNPSGGTVTDRPPAGGWTYRHTGNELGPAGSFTFRANDGAADSNVATANLVAVAKRGRCVNPFTGTHRRDTIIGSRFGDRVRGRRGHDSLRGRAGRDCLLGHAGRDRMSGHGHADRLVGHGGRDRLAGNAGRDRLFGNQGNDRLLGGGGGDGLRGGSGRNVYSAGAGADRVFARNNKRDRIRCGKGRDRVVADQNDRVSGDCEGVRRG
jgi:RTX calcium-binding nonapeptide repeat (4 copies)/LVIVD repeat